MQLSPFHKSLWELPESPDLGVRSLAAVFRHTTNSYKFYWFLAILEALKNNLHRVSLDFLTAEMIAQVWYPVHMFKLNLGALDQLGLLAKILRQKRRMDIITERHKVRQEALQLIYSDSSFAQALAQLQKFVPQRFLSPWFESSLRGVPDHQKNKHIIQLAEVAFEQDSPPLYRLVSMPNGEILVELHPDWIVYLCAHHSVLHDFILSNLSAYLAKCNPNEPNISEKILPPKHEDEQNIDDDLNYETDLLEADLYSWEFDDETAPSQQDPAYLELITKTQMAINEHTRTINQIE